MRKLSSLTIKDSWNKNKSRNYNWQNRSSHLRYNERKRHQ